MLKVITEFIRALHHILFIFPSSPVTYTAVALVSLPSSEIKWGKRDTQSLQHKGKCKHFRLPWKPAQPSSLPTTRYERERGEIKVKSNRGFSHSLPVEKWTLIYCFVLFPSQSMPLFVLLYRTQDGNRFSVLKLGDDIIIFSLYNQPKPAHRVWILTVSNRVLMLDWPQHKLTSSTTS